MGYNDISVTMKAYMHLTLADRGYGSRDGTDVRSRVIAERAGKAGGMKDEKEKHSMKMFRVF